MFYLNLPAILDNVKNKKPLSNLKSSPIIHYRIGWNENT